MKELFVLKTSERRNHLLGTDLAPWNQADTKFFLKILLITLINLKCNLFGWINLKFI